MSRRFVFHAEKFDQAAQALKSNQVDVIEAKTRMAEFYGALSAAALFGGGMWASYVYQSLWLMSGVFILFLLGVRTVYFKEKSIQTAVWQWCTQHSPGLHMFSGVEDFSETIDRVRPLSDAASVEMLRLIQEAGETDHEIFIMAQQHRQKFGHWPCFLWEMKPFLKNKIVPEVSMELKSLEGFLDTGLEMGSVLSVATVQGEKNRFKKCIKTAEHGEENNDRA